MGYRKLVFDGVGIELIVVNTKSPESIFFLTSKIGDANGFWLGQIIEVESMLATYFSISTFCIGEYL